MNDTPNIDLVIHDRVEQYYNLYNALPKLIPVTHAEYHQLEKQKGYACLCWDKVTRRKRPITYTIGSIVMKVDIQEGVVHKLKERGIITI